MTAIEIRAELDAEVPERLLAHLRRGALNGITVSVPPIEAREAINLIASAAVAAKDRRWRRMVSDELDRIASAPSEESDPR